MGLQNIIRLLLPKEDHFYDYLEQQASMAHEGAKAMGSFGKPGSTAQSVRDAVQDCEHRGDKIVHEMEEALAKTFVTPIDREDLQKLSSELDTVLDLTNGAARACVLFGVETPTPPMTALMTKLEGCTAILARTVPCLRKHAYGELINAGREIKAIEKEADIIFRDAVSALFHNEHIDAKVLLREKEVLDDLENAIDHCERVGFTLTNLAVKHG